MPRSTPRRAGMARGAGLQPPCWRACRSCACVPLACRRSSWSPGALKGRLGSEEPTGGGRPRPQKRAPSEPRDAAIARTRAARCIARMARPPPAASTLRFLLWALLVAAAVADPPLSAPLPDAALDAFVANRFVAAARPGRGAADVGAALARGVAARQLLGADAGAAHAPDTTNAALGVVSFKFANTPASPQAAAQVRPVPRASAMLTRAPRAGGPGLAE